jgi:hypothetical protein
MAGSICAWPVFASGFEDAASAYERQDYATSLRIVRPLAESGDVRAQYLLGRHYQFGQVVLADRAEAFFWYRRAEMGGHIEAKLFRHLLESQWGVTARERARAEQRLAAIAEPARNEMRSQVSRPKAEEAAVTRAAEREPAPIAASRVEVEPPKSRAEARVTPAPARDNDTLRDLERGERPRATSRAPSFVPPLREPPPARNPRDEEDDDFADEPRLSRAPLPPNPMWSGHPFAFETPPTAIPPAYAYRPTYYWHPGWRFRPDYSYPRFRNF